ncbi:MAG: hypothetical protein R2719_02235 [Micropruina sp.]
MHPATILLFIVTLMVWTDDTSWWTRGVATASFLISILIDLRRRR